jgi:hypothetical protein
VFITQAGQAVPAPPAPVEPVAPVAPVEPDVPPTSLAAHARSKVIGAVARRIARK